MKNMKNKTVKIRECCYVQRYKIVLTVGVAVSR